MSRPRLGGWLLIGSFLGFVPLAISAALSPVNVALRAEADKLGLPYTNGVLPVEIQGRVMAENASALSAVTDVAAIVIWVAFALGISFALGRRGASLVGVVAAWLAVASWLTMGALDVNLQQQLGAGFSADYWHNWFLAEGLLSAFAAIAVAVLAIQLLRAGRSRIVTIGVLALAALIAVGSLVLVSEGGLPPAVGPQLGAVLGVVLVRRRSVHETGAGSE